MVHHAAVTSRDYDASAESILPSHNKDHMSSNNPYASNSSNPRGYNTAPTKSRKKLWWIIAAIVAVCVIVAAVVGGVVGSRKSKSSSSSSSDNSSGKGDSTASGGEHGTAFPTGSVGASTGNTALPTMLAYIGTNLAAQTQTGVNGEVYLAVATDVYMLPAYATGTYTDNLPAPTNDASPGTNGAWPTDPSPPSTSAIRSHPRLIAPQYKWDALTGGMIAADPYLSYWNATIIGNASDTLGDAPTPYTEDGGLTGSGVLDVARAIKLKVKNWAYAYRITKDTKYADRVWLELRTAAGNNSDVPFGTDASRWNGAGHFLDLGEFCNAFAIGYDWLYDAWTDDQKSTLREWITSFGLQYGLNAYQNLNGGGSYNWWSGQAPGVGGSEVNGNWNCVCNGGLLLASLAIVDEDTTGMAKTLIDLTQGSLKTNCFNGPHSDGTWAETANYWYFGTSAAGEIVASLLSAYGDDGGLSTVNPGWNLTSLYHIYVQGMTSLFNYGDHGPNKYATTANSLMLWSTVFNEPRYALYQRDHYDAAEPWSMFYYDPTVEGAWWNGLPIDHHFNDPKGEWATARSSWSDNSGTYWAIKAGNLTGHQTHGDLDHGDFVFDAMGQRWAGDLGSGQYLADGYFSNETQQSERWDYYRKRTDGQNTMLINYENQLVTGMPVTTWGSTGTAQGAAPYLSLDKTDTAFFTMDMSTSYSSGSVKRGIRFLNGRRQMLLQDEVTGATSGQDIQWRMHTNATVSTNGASATLTLAGKTLKVDILNANPSGLTFTTMDAVRLSQDGALPTGSQYDVDIPNDGTTVLVIENSAGGSFTTQVLFTPQWPDMQSSDYVTNPTNVALDQWSLTSHN